MPDARQGDGLPQDRLPQGAGWTERGFRNPQVPGSTEPAHRSGFESRREVLRTRYAQREFVSALPDLRGELPSSYPSLGLAFLLNCDRRHQSAIQRRTLRWFLLLGVSH
jgi:hypothetical protein